MVEGDWHKQVREELKKKYEQHGFKVITSHDDKKLMLFYDNYKRENCLSDIDMIIMKDNETQLIEIQQSLRPKELIGIIASTNLTNKFRIDGEDYPLKNAVLMIITKKQKEKSRKNEQLKLIKSLLKPSKGSLKDFEFEEAE